ncbi:hypothetical protein PHLCEN_2v11260 [Hermanssonia centrifuga]|uniref:Uncharacterized protein n=1 Tax=Hermanssonia centrifuga TaxID=98765 RepID=A0A2R6NKK7_9APHY|nr:hypothetical protein PHLCEN_2v11260 [Hermanssonia centrifuga]
MSNFREAYTALNGSSPRSEVSAVLQSITDSAEIPFKLDDANRQQLIQLIIDDLTLLTKGSNGSSKCRLVQKDAAQALLTIKIMGKNPAGSVIIATRANFSALLAILHFFKDDVDASNEVLRCIANALLLIETGRNVLISKDVGGGSAMVELLEKTTSPERIFLVSRILFLATLSVAYASDFIQALVENKHAGHHSHIVEVITTKLESLTSSLLASEKMSRDAMRDLLKVAFNLMHHYPKMVDKSTDSSGRPKIMGECWSSRLDGLVPPLLRLFNSLPPTFPAPLASPMTYVIHTLITVPVTPSLRSKWFPILSNPGSPNQSSKSISPVSSPSAPGSPATRGSRSGSPVKETKEVKPGAFDRALSRLSVSHRLSHRSTSPPSRSIPDTLLRAYDLLDVTLSHYLPGNIDPDDSSVRERCHNESDSTLDELVCPLVLLITKLCNGDEGARKRMMEWILPQDLDRSSPLEARSDLLGRSLRLLASIHHSRMKESIGEMLYAICDSNGATLSSYVGYGNVAGLLFSKGIMSAPSVGDAGAPDTTADGKPIDPITGVAQREQNTGPEMTDEEKELEAEKLFVLFDRLERSGAIDPTSNPIRKAIASGKGPAY